MFSRRMIEKCEQPCKNTRACSWIVEVSARAQVKGLFNKLQVEFMSVNLDEIRT